MSNIAFSIGRIILISGIIIIVLMPLLFIHMHIHIPKMQIYQTPDNFGLKYNKINIKTSDNINLSGWHIPKENHKGTIIVSHGVGANKSDIMSVAIKFNSGGYEVYMFDLRGHGESDNAKITYGYNERKDIKAIVDYLKTHDKKELGIYGLSMGAAIVLLSAPENPEIKVVIVDSAFTSVEHIMKYRIGQVFKGAFNDLLSNIVKFYTKLIYNVPIDEIAPIKIIDKINRPILFIIGDSDTNITPDNGQMLYDKATEPKEIFIVKGANHIDTISDPNYQTKIVEFMDKYLFKKTDNE